MHAERFEPPGNGTLERDRLAFALGHAKPQDPRRAARRKDPQTSERHVERVYVLDRLLHRGDDSIALR